MKKINDALLEQYTGKHSTVNNDDVVSKKYSYTQQLTPALAQIYQEVQRELALYEQQQSDSLMSHQELLHLIVLTSDRLGVDISTYERDQVLAFLEKDQKPFGILQSLVDDKDVSDIIVSGYAKIAVQQGRKNFHTDIAFPSQEIYEAFVERLLTRAGSSYSTKTPVADGMIGRYARLHAVHPAIAEGGPYLTIRINRFSEVQINDLHDYGLAPRHILEYLRRIVVSGHTLLVVGEVGTGKTTLARALASALPQDESILVIEDTPEIKLVHPHVRYVKTRSENNDGAGRVAPSECIRAGMRMAMNRIIFGEIRDAEAAESFIDVCASGHPGLSTIHARSSSEALSRLELFLGRAQKGVSQAVLQQQIATAVQAVVHINICKDTGQRRIFDIREIGPVTDGAMRQKEIFHYEFRQEVPLWHIRNKVSYFKAALEEGGSGFKLHELGDAVELDFDVAYREAAKRAA